MTRPIFLESRKIADATRSIGETQEEYNTLHIRDEDDAEGKNVMVSEWKPTEKELSILNNGGSVYLGVLGVVHPPVYVAVAPSSETNDNEAAE